MTPNLFYHLNLVAAQHPDVSRQGDDVRILQIFSLVSSGAMAQRRKRLIALTIPDLPAGLKRSLAEGVRPPV
jgi:hypothetical protein